MSCVIFISHLSNKAKKNKKTKKQKKHWSEKKSLLYSQLNFSYFIVKSKTSTVVVSSGIAKTVAVHLNLSGVLQAGQVCWG